MIHQLDSIENDRIRTFKELHPYGRIYEMNFLDGDRIGQIAYFEITGWIIKVQIVGIAKGKTLFKRIEMMTFE